MLGSHQLYFAFSFTTNIVPMRRKFRSIQPMKHIRRMDQHKPQCCIANGAIESVANDNGKPRITSNLDLRVNESLTELLPAEATLGRYVARRLKEIGATDVFAVPGDSNLVLLDHLLAEPGMNLVGCCNELNAGYAADGYARCRGVGACVFTFTVGGLSAINAVAGAYSESLPLICIVGGPNTNYYGSNVTLHHTIGLPDFSQELRCFEPVTCHQAVVNNLEDAQHKIDEAILAALEHSKPVYISISCNLPGIPHSSFTRKPVPFVFSPKLSNPLSLEAAVEAAASLLNKAAKPVLVAGPKIGAVKEACDAFIDLANTSGYCFAVLPSAKGLVPENHPHFTGTYWGPLSSPACSEIVESADATLFVGPIFDDINTVGHSIIFKKEAMIVVNQQSVVIGDVGFFGGVMMGDFLKAVARRVKYRNGWSCGDYSCGMNMSEEVPPRPSAKEGLKISVLYKHVQKMLSGDTVLVSEVGDSWFHCQKLKLPQGCRFEVQMHYASLGWSVGATLGFARAAPDKRVIACIGDGGFQMTGQEVSTMLRCGQRSIMFVINNGGYGIEAQIHEGSYNVIKNWDYTGFVDAIQNGQGKCWAAKVGCEEELVVAIDMAMREKKDCLCFIEVMIHPNDSSREVLQLGTRLAAANSLPPRSRYK